VTLMLQITWLAAAVKFVANLFLAEGQDWA
jgi:hypothetical protein